jgi:hypothetical protein
VRALNDAGKQALSEGMGGSDTDIDRTWDPNGGNYDGFISDA